MCFCFKHLQSTGGSTRNEKSPLCLFLLPHLLSYKRKNHPWVIYRFLDNLRARFLSHCKSSRNAPQNSLQEIGLVEAEYGVEKGIVTEVSPHSHKSLDFSTCDMDSCEECSLIQINNFPVPILSRII